MCLYRNGAIAEAIGVGRMPVREALRDLGTRGIVSVEPGRGTFLRRLGTVEITELLEVRLALECMAARLAAEKGFTGDLPQLVAELRSCSGSRSAGRRVRAAEAIGDRVHRAVVQGASNEILNSLYAGLALRIGISLRLVQLREVGRIRQTVDEHLAVAEAILACKPDPCRQGAARPSASRPRHHDEEP
jgi:DNA-binding GntR family transcriptional regulator